MANPKKGQKVKATGGKASKGGVTPKGFMVGVMILSSLPFMMPTAIVLLGLLPTFVIALTDREPGMYKAYTIGAMNFAGVIPFLVDLWKKNHSTDYAFMIMSNPNNLLIMFGCAAIGHLINISVPMAIAIVSQFGAEIKIRNLRRQQELMKKLWGDDVSSDKQNTY
jgi:hypothetical protein